MDANQVVAHNVALYRKRLRMTQEDLGEQVGKITGTPWSNASVSAAERSVDGKRPRKFDAEEIRVLAKVLGTTPEHLLTAPGDESPEARTERICREMAEYPLSPESQRLLDEMKASQEAATEKFMRRVAEIEARRAAHMDRLELRLINLRMEEINYRARREDKA